MPRKKSKTKRKLKPSDCRNKKNGEPCSGKYVVQGNSNPPLFVCNLCGDENDTWKKFYEEYLHLFKQRENWDEPKHKVSCILGFFMFKYKEKFGADYTLVSNNPNPFSCKELRDINKLLATFGGDANRVRKYIHWAFKKVIRRQTDLVSFAYLNAAGLIRKYNLHESKKTMITRHTRLPAKFVRWCENNTQIFDDYELSTMNDLGAILGYSKQYPDEDGEYSDEQKVIDQAKGFGLIKNGALNTEE